MTTSVKGAAGFEYENDGRSKLELKGTILLSVYTGMPKYMEKSEIKKTCHQISEK